MRFGLSLGLGRTQTWPKRVKILHKFCDKITQHKDFHFKGKIELRKNYQQYGHRKSTFKAKPKLDFYDPFQYFFYL